MGIYPRPATNKNFGGPDVPGMVKVPAQMKPAQNFRYPSDNAITFERWFMDMFRPPDARKRLYLPVQWTAIYCNGKFGKDMNAIRQVQEFLKSLDSSKKYYTIVQYDDGILNDLTALDIKVLAMSAGQCDYPLPLLCMPHRPIHIAKDIIANFIGRNTHPIRQQMMETLAGCGSYHLSYSSHPMADYCSYISRSKFTLAPRGYGPTSFRICEAVLGGSIPVYISDHHIVPYNLPFDYGLLLHPGDDVAEAIRQADQTLLNANRKKAEPLFTYKGAKTQLLSQIDCL